MKNIKFDYLFYLFLVLLLLLFAIAARAQTEQNSSPQIAATGGNFILEKAVLAGGGNQTTQSPLTLGGTSGQSIAGLHSTGGGFSLYSGFWTADNNFAPTAATVTISGKVLSPLIPGVLNVPVGKSDEQGITQKLRANAGLINAYVNLTDSRGTTRTVRTGKDGVFSFTEVAAGETYILSVSSKRYEYAPQIISPIEDISDIIVTVSGF